MLKNIILISAVISFSLLTGCASVPMESPKEDAIKKKFTKPVGNKSGLYIYRNTFIGKALKKMLYLDGKMIGETANKVYFYKEIKPGSHKLSTESEFGENSINFNANSGQNYFAEQYIKMGVFVGGAGIKMVPEAKGKSNVLKCRLAKGIN